MIPLIKFKRWLISIIIAIILSGASVCAAGVAVLDGVTTVNTPIRITVQTRNRFFAAGGRLVDVYLDDEHLKRILTGGDGYGYLKYTPASPGFKKVKVRFNSESAEGLLLVMTPKEWAIVIEVEEGFKSAVFSDKIKKASLQAVKTLSKSYKIIYLSRYVGKSITTNWLENQGYPESVVLGWRGPGTLTDLKKKGIQLYALIGSAAVLSEAHGEVEKRYTFETSKNGTAVRDWEQILQHLQEERQP